MPTFEHCADCGELRVEHYGAVTENKCVECAAVERQTLAKSRTTILCDPHEDETIGYADFPKAESRRHIRIMTLISGQIEYRDGPRKFNILDISKSGAKLRMEPELAKGMLTLTFPKIGRLHATPSWCDGSNTGVTFIESHKEVIATMGKVMPQLEAILRAA